MYRRVKIVETLGPAPAAHDLAANRVVDDFMTFMELDAARVSACIGSLFLAAAILPGSKVCQERLTLVQHLFCYIHRIHRLHPWAPKSHHMEKRKSGSLRSVHMMDQSSIR